ncbi:hypothetical protein V8J88_11625 [Massilia sp. W12]|uniref:hypothetical protein n=1 Tax=Massilia sp. W12 TaxID=3126507 RepID=UPI0030D3A858
MQTLSLEQFRTAVAAGGVASVSLQAIDGEFFVRIHTCNNTQALLAHARSNSPRGFPNPLPAITLLHKLGVTVGEFDISQWNPEQKPLARKRPDRQRAMQAAQAALEHDQWFRAQVAQALQEADAPDAEWISEQDAQTAWENKRQQFARQLDDAGAAA